MQSPNSRSELEQLQKLLVGDEQQALNQLSRRVENPEQRTRDVAEVLADAIRLSAQDRALEAVLREPIERAMRESIRRDPREIANLLYPIILPAIRRSIEESLRAFAERIDLLVQQQLSVNSLKWRFEAWRTGTPFTEVMLRYSLRYSVEHLLLIQEHSGLLIKQAHAKDAVMADSDAVSAMLNAIESFVRDSFSHEDGEQLNRITFGSKIIYLVHGPHAMLASVVRGTAPPDYLSRLKELIEDIHNTAPRALRDYNGDPRTLETVDPLLNSGFEREFITRKNARQKEQKDAEASKKNRKKLAYWLLALITLIACYSAFHYYQTRGINHLMKSLKSQPGIYISDFSQQNGKWRIKGLVSENFQSLPQLIAESGVDQNKLVLDLQTFSPQQPKASTLQQLVSSVGLPKSLQLKNTDGHYSLEGVAPVDWFLKVKSRPELAREIDLSSITLDAKETGEYLRNAAELPANVAIVADDGLVVVSGKVTAVQLKKLTELKKLMAGHVTVDLKKLAGER